MTTVPATQFVRHFRRYRADALREPVSVTANGQTAGVFVSVQQFEELQHLKSMRREALLVSELSADEIAAIEAAEMGSEHDHLNALLDAE